MNPSTAAVLISVVAAIALVTFGACAVGHDGALVTGAIAALSALGSGVIAREVGKIQGKAEERREILTRTRDYPNNLRRL